MTNEHRQRLSAALADLALAYQAGGAQAVTRSLASGRLGQVSLTIRTARDAMTGAPDGVHVTGVVMRGDVLYWTPDETETLLQRAGLDVVRITSTGQRWTAWCRLPISEEQSA